MIKIEEGLSDEEAREEMRRLGVPEAVVQQALPNDWTFEMDGSTHEAPTRNTGCCDSVGKQCTKCGSWMHYQPVYGGYFYQCEKCDNHGL